MSMTYDLTYNWRGTRWACQLESDLTEAEIGWYIEQFCQHCDRMSRSSPLEFAMYLKHKDKYGFAKNMVMLRSEETIREYEEETGLVLEKDVKRGYCG